MEVDTCTAIRNLRGVLETTGHCLSPMVEAWPITYSLGRGHGRAMVPFLLLHGLLASLGQVTSAPRASILLTAEQIRGMTFKKHSEN